MSSQIRCPILQHTDDCIGLTVFDQLCASAATIPNGLTTAIPPGPAYFRAVPVPTWLMSESVRLCDFEGHSHPKTRSNTSAKGHHHDLSLPQLSSKTGVVNSGTNNCGCAILAARRFLKIWGLFFYTRPLFGLSNVLHDQTETIKTQLNGSEDTRRLEYHSVERLNAWQSAYWQ